MSSDNDRCFQCQETGHMAHYYPHIRCYDCDNYGHVAMDCLEKIPPSGTPGCTAGLVPMTEAGGLSSRHNSHIRHSRHEHRNRSRFSCSWSRTHDHSYRSSSRHDPHRSWSRSLHRSSHCHFSCDRSSSSHHRHRDTPHCRHSRNASWDNSRSHHRSGKHHYKLAWGSSLSSHTASWKSKDRKHKQVTINNPLSDYYSSDDINSDSDDDLI